VPKDDEEVLPAPSHLSFEELAALPTAGGTAFNSLFCGPQPLKAGQTVLTQGTGGVSCFAIQLASAAGCTVISTSSSDAKLEIARELGAKHTINYTQTPGWAEEVLNLTRGNGVDHVLDVGGANTILQSLKAVKQGGVVSVVGILGPGDEAGIVAALLFGGKTMRGIFGGNKKVWEGLLKMVGKKEVLPRVEMVLGWGEEEVKGAFELLGRREAVGKIVVRVGGE
jgi:NADPH:quinone reductase-like Zn-dependent oxidoreductase